MKPLSANLYVKKFGGTSLGSTEQIDRVSQYLHNCHEAGERFVVVASAMAGETNRLINLAKNIHKDPNPEFYDFLFSTGEHAACALLSIALNRRGVSAYPLRGADLPIVTEGGHMKARIHHIDTRRLMDMLESGAVPIVAGCQGVDHASARPTTLGRGGSDTTAVALAVALGGVSCEIFTDVDGVYSTDPRICPTAKLLPHVDYLEMMEMASMGAKVMHIRSMDLAYRYAVPIHVRSSFSWKEGTMITERPQDGYERLCVSTVTCDENQAKIMVHGLEAGTASIQKLFSPLAKAHINIDMIVQSFNAPGKMDLYFTVSTAEFDKAMLITQREAQKMGDLSVSGDDKVAKVSALGSGMMDHYGVANKFFEVLARQSIPVFLTSTSEIKISVLIPQEKAKQATEAIHKVFIESAWDPSTEYSEVSESIRLSW